MVPREIRSSSDEEGEDDSGITQQLQTLRPLIPNITKTDARSILEETHDYLQRIHEETEKVEKELSLGSDNPSSSGRQGLQILRVETEKLMEGRFVVKISWKRGSGVAGNVQRVIECLDVKMTSIVLNERNPDEMLTTAFVKVKKEKKMTEEELHDLIMNAAARFGLQT